MNIMRRIAFATACVMLAGAAVIAQTAEPRDEFLKLADKLMDEAQRQHNVNERMDTTVLAVNVLVDDLKSNGLLREGRAEEMQRIAVVLAKLSTDHVPNAAKYLEAAKAHLEALKPAADNSEISSADAEIKLIVRELEGLLTKAGQFQAGEDLLTELRMIIQKQDAATEGTTAWGKQLLADPTAEGKKDELSSRQSDLVKDVDHFSARLKESKDSAEFMDKPRLEQAYAAMSKMDIDGEMNSAAASISDKKPIAAVAQQKKASDDLREIEKLLMADQLLEQINQLTEEKQDLEQLLQKQQELRKKTEQSPLTPDQKKDLQNQQRDLENQTKKIQQDNKDANPPEADQNLENAHHDMKNAEDKIDQQQKEDAVKEQKKAEQELTSAIKAVNQKIDQDQKQREEKQDPDTKQDPDEQKLEDINKLTQQQQQVEDQTKLSEDKDLPKLEPQETKIEEKVDELKLPKPKQDAHDAAEDLKAAKKPEALKHEEQVLEKLKEEGNKLKEKIEQKHAKMKPEKKPDEPKTEGERKSTKNPAAGPAVEGDSKWSSMSQRDRDALYQKYERELPLEYKEMLESYYEALSK